MFLATIAGIGGAFALKHKTHQSGPLYYSHKDADGHIRWYSNPGVWRCTPYSSLACTITSTSNVSVVVDAYPAQYSVAGSQTINAINQ